MTFGAKCNILNTKNMQNNVNKFEQPRTSVGLYIYSAQIRISSPGNLSYTSPEEAGEARYKGEDRENRGNAYRRKAGKKCATMPPVFLEIPTPPPRRENFRREFSPGRR